ncbi:hypothetical protein EDC04DRAFT_2588779, partial [Pisolithus marmoratus]
YLAQAPGITSIVQDKINTALSEFHDHKDTIIDEGFRQALDHWLIPKLELMQSVTLSISELGMPVQWSVDMTEHTHIEVIKEPASMMNNHNYNTQICHYLDCVERCQLFKTATHLSAALNNTNGHDLLDSAIEDDTARDDETNAEDGEENSMAILSNIWSPRCCVPNFFTIAEQLRTAPPGSTPLPAHTFISGATAICVNYKPPILCISIGEAAELFNLPDLQGALTDYLGCEGAYAQNFHSFGQQWGSSPDAHLLFKDLQIWHKVCLQQKSYHDSSSLGSVFTVNAHCPDCMWQYGCHDAGILQVDECHEWPSSSLTGM